MNLRLFSLIAVLAIFSVDSAGVVLEHGYFGFIELAQREPWALQVLIDLVIALVLFASWMLPDARRKGITAWPYLPVIATLGSIGALAYLVHRTLRQGRAEARGTRHQDISRKPCRLDTSSVVVR